MSKGKMEETTPNFVTDPETGGGGSIVKSQTSCCLLPWWHSKKI